MRNMKGIVVVILIGIAFVITVFLVRGNERVPAITRGTTNAENDGIVQSSNETNLPMTTFLLESSTFAHEGKIPPRITCDANDVSPALAWSGVPECTKSFALIMDDPDAPKAGTWDHWVVFNIPPHIEAVAEGVEPAGEQGVGSSGKRGYQGPCPPVGEHRYFFRLYALDTELLLEPGARKADVLLHMEGHVLGVAELMGKYQKVKIL